LFVQSVQDCIDGESTYDVLGGLFREMNTPGITPAGRFKGVDYFNGGLFQQIDPIELTPQELKFLQVSALEDWSKCAPPSLATSLNRPLTNKTATPTASTTPPKPTS
jgi:hypothetical protein